MINWKVYTIQFPFYLFSHSSFTQEITWENATIVVQLHFAEKNPNKIRQQSSKKMSWISDLTEEKVILRLPFLFNRNFDREQDVAFA